MILPYLGVAALLFVAVYVLFKAVVEAVDAQDSADTLAILKDVARNTLVLCGITVAARLPRLTHDKWLRGLAIVVPVLACAVYYFTAPVVPPTVIWGIAFPPGAPTVVLAGIVIALAYLCARFFPLTGVMPLMLAGGLVVAGKVAWQVARVAWGVGDAREIGRIWPVFIAIAGFLYLWWLAALIFDVVVVWHWYIRSSRILERMDELMGGKRERTPRDSSGRSTRSKPYAPQVQR